MNRPHLPQTLAIIGYFLTLLFLWLPYTTLNIIPITGTIIDSPKVAYIFQDNAYIPLSANLEIIESNFDNIWDLGSPKYLFILGQTLLFTSIITHQSKRKGVIRTLLILFTITLFGYLFFYFPNSNSILLGTTQIQNLKIYEIEKVSVFLPAITSLIVGFIILIVALGFAIESGTTQEQTNIIT